MHTSYNHRLKDTLTYLSQIPSQSFSPSRTPLVEAFKEFSKYKEWFSTRLTPLCYPSNYEALFFTPEVDLESGFEIASSSDASAAFDRIFEHELNNIVCLYTAGSAPDNLPSTGLSIVLKTDNILGSFKMAGFASSFCVEFLAVFEALRIIKEKKWKNSTIFTDSRSCLVAINSTFRPEHSSHIILDIKDCLFLLKKDNFVIKLVWVPSHRHPGKRGSGQGC